MNIKDVIKLVKIMELVPDFAKNVFDKLEKKAELIEYLNNSKGKFQILGSIVLAKDINKDDPLDNFLDKIFKDGNKKDKFEEQAVNLFGFFNTLKLIINQKDNKIPFYLNELIKSYNKIKKDDLKLDKGNLNLIEDQQSHKNLENFIETYNNEIEKIKSAKIVDNEGKEINENRIKELMKSRGIPVKDSATSQQSAGIQKEVLDLITPYLPFITNPQIEENYKNAKTYEELIEAVKKIISSIFDDEVKEEDKIKQVKALTETIESLNKLYKAFFNKLNLFNLETLENNECIISNEITKIAILHKISKELNNYNNTQDFAKKLDKIFNMSDKSKKINEILNAYKDMTTKPVYDYNFLDYNDIKISTDDSKIKKLLDSIKNDDNELSKLINKIIIFSEEVISITNLLKEIILPQELKIE